LERFDKILEWLTPILVAIIGWFISHMLNSIEKKIDSTLTQATETNGGLRELKIWAIEHEKNDTRYFEQIDAVHSEMKEDIKALRNRK
jgi:hypothetical protein